MRTWLRWFSQAAIPLVKPPTAAPVRAASAEMMETSTGAVRNLLLGVIITEANYCVTTRTTAALRKSAVNFVVRIDKTRTIAFGHGTGSEAVAARARVTWPTPARSQSRCCADGGSRGWRSSCRPPPYCLCCDTETVDHPCVP